MAYNNLFIQRWVVPPCRVNMGSTIQQYAVIEYNLPERMVDIRPPDYELIPRYCLRTGRTIDDAIKSALTNLLDIGYETNNIKETETGIITLEEEALIITPDSAYEIAQKLLLEYMPVQNVIISQYRSNK